MKKALLVLVLSICSLSLFSQEVEVSKKNKNKYSFEYTISMDDEKSDRYKSRLMSECIEIKDIKMKNGVCVIEFKKDTPQDRIDKILLYCVTKFDYTSYKIK